MSDHEHSIFFVGDGGEHHHFRKTGPGAGGQAAAIRDAGYLLSRPNSGPRRLHAGWSTGLEVWRIYAGDHEQFAVPDQRLAHARWGDETLRHPAP